VELRQNKYLNNIVEQDHRAIKRLVKPGMGCGSFNTARTIKGYKIMNMMRKGEIKNVRKGAVTERVKFIAEIFECLLVDSLPRSLLSSTTFCTTSEVLT